MSRLLQTAQFVPEHKQLSSQLTTISHNHLSDLNTTCSLQISEKTFVDCCHGNFYKPNALADVQPQH